MKTSKTIFTTGRQQSKGGETVTRQIVLEDWLARPSKSDEKNGPREMPSYSRFTMTLISKSSVNGKSFVFGNIPETDVLGILVPRVNKIHDMLMERELNPQTKKETSSAPYKYMFGYGKLKGQTVASYLSAGVTSQKIEDIKGTRGILMSNIERYPGNRQGVEEIDRILKEIKEGTFKADAASGPSEWPVYIKEHKPLVTRVDKEGRVLTYGIRITCNPAMSMPWAVSIYNGYCPMTRSGGKDLPEESKMVNRQDISFRLTDDEFMTMVTSAHVSVLTFENLVKGQRVMDAEEMDRANMPTK